MPSVFVTALSALLLVYADLQSWSAVAIVGLVCLGSAAASLAVEKHSHYASALVAGSLIICDALSRHYETAASSLHSSVAFGDFVYPICLFATIGWTIGWFVRRKHVMPEKMEIYEPPRTNFVISPAFAPKSAPRRANHRWSSTTRSA
ncbi:MAG: hypothetical protein ROO76_18500 [Terriglobia bacterium]|jgi:hypothetical protein|nr:hypothetical protein [Terriglobia bacterium]